MKLQIISLPIVSGDERRSIFELGFPIPATVRISVLQVAVSDAPLGNHYHRDQTEYFLLTAGVCELTTQVVGDAEAALVVHSLEVPCLVVMPPGVAHSFTFAGAGALVCLSDREFDQADLIPYQFN